MKNISVSLTVLLLMLVTSQINSQNISSEKSEILELQDRRTLGEDDQLINIYIHQILKYEQQLFMLLQISAILQSLVSLIYFLPGTILQTKNSKPLLFFLDRYPVKKAEMLLTFFLTIQMILRNKNIP